MKQYYDISHTPNSMKSLGYFLLCLLMLSMAAISCSGGGNGTGPTDNRFATLSGKISFGPNIPLAPPPPDTLDGISPTDSHFVLRIVDPGDDIGNTPRPKPSTLNVSGSYEFDKLDEKPSAFLNLGFTVASDLENNGSARTPVGFNLPVSLIEGANSLLTANIELAAKNTLRVLYSYNGPDGARVVRFQLDFASDLIAFDLDSDGLYDDLVAIDVNHDGIPDDHAPLFAKFDVSKVKTTYGTITSSGTNSVTVSGKTFKLLGNSNVTNIQNGNALSLAECSPGITATVFDYEYGSSNIALNIKLVPTINGTSVKINVVRDGAIEQISENSIIVGGVFFKNINSAEIKNLSGKSLTPSDLKSGDYVEITGSRTGTEISAEKIVLHDITPPPSTIERLGSISQLAPLENPTSIVVAGLEFRIISSTVITDLIGYPVLISSLSIGDPVWVSGHYESNVLIADIISLQYVVTPPNGKEVEIVVLVDKASEIDSVESAIESLSLTTQSAVIQVASYPPVFSDPPCLNAVFDELFWYGYVLKNIPGFVEAYPRVIDGECTVLALVEDGYPLVTSYIDIFLPDGIGGAKLIYDKVSFPPFYGKGSEYNQAEIDSNKIEALFDYAGSPVVRIYISPDKHYSN